jgi:hypothetical protein
LFDLQAGSGGTQPAAKSGGAAAPGSRPHSVGPSASQSRADQVRERAFRYFSCVGNSSSAFRNCTSDYRILLPVFYHFYEQPEALLILRFAERLHELLGKCFYYRYCSASVCNIQILTILSKIVSCPLDLPSEGRMRLPLSAGGGTHPPPLPWLDVGR